MQEKKVTCLKYPLNNKDRRVQQPLNKQGNIGNTICSQRLYGEKLSQTLPKAASLQPLSADDGQEQWQVQWEDRVLVFGKDCTESLKEERQSVILRLPCRTHFYKQSRKRELTCWKHPQGKHQKKLQILFCQNQSLSRNGKQWCNRETSGLAEQPYTTYFYFSYNFQNKINTNTHRIIQFRRDFGMSLSQNREHISLCNTKLPSVQW